jgi:hypothetical protein
MKHVPLDFLWKQFYIKDFIMIDKKRLILPGERNGYYCMENTGFMFRWAIYG